MNQLSLLLKDRVEIDDPLMLLHELGKYSEWVGALALLV
jgi:hypothetical protein